MDSGVATGPLAALTHTLLLAGVIAAAGVLGGLANFVIYSRNLRLEASAPKVVGSLSRWDSILLGVAAAAVVPLFITLIDLDANGIVNSVYSASSAGALAEVLVLLFSYCTLAAIFSRNFLFSLYSRVLQSAEDAANVAATRRAEEVVENAEKEEEDRFALDQIFEANAGTGELADVPSLQDVLTADLTAAQTALLRLIRNYPNANVPEDHLKLASKLPTDEFRATLDTLRVLGMISSSQRGELGESRTWRLRSRGRMWMLSQR